MCYQCCCKNLPSNKDSHDSQHDEKGNGSKSLGVFGENEEEDEEHSHECSDDRCTTSTEKIRNNTDNNSTRHHTNRVKRSDEVCGDRIEVLSQKVWKPEEKDVVGKLEETEGKGILGNHRNTESSCVGNGGWSLILNMIPLFGALCSKLVHTDADLGSNDTCVSRIGNQSHGEETPGKVGNSGDEKSPPVRESSTKDDGGTESSSDITAVLMACPETEDETTVFNRLFVAEPVSHHGSS